MMPNFVLNQDKVTEFCSNASFLISSSENAATSLRWIAGRSQHISQVIYLQVKFLFNSKCHTTKKFRQISGNKYTKKKLLLHPVFLQVEFTHWNWLTLTLLSGWQDSRFGVNFLHYNLLHQPPPFHIINSV